MSTMSKREGVRDSVSIKVSEFVLQAPSELLYISYFVSRVWKKYVTQLLPIVCIPFRMFYQDPQHVGLHSSFGGEG